MTKPTSSTAGATKPTSSTAGAARRATGPRVSPPATGKPAWTRVVVVAGAAGVLAGSAVMAGLWALGHWGTAWLVSRFTGQASPPIASLPFAFGSTTAGALAVATGLTAALSLGREMTAHSRRNHGSSATRRQPSTPS